MEFVTSIGSAITKTIRMMYFRYLKGFSLAVEKFFPRGFYEADPETIQKDIKIHI